MAGQTNRPELPTLGSGLTLLEVDDRSTGALHSLVLDHLLLEKGSAVWIDAHGHGTTQPLTQVASSMRLLERITVARGFTPWQHYSLLRDLPLDDRTTLVVLPSIDYFYRSRDCSGREGKRMFTAVCTLVADLAATAEIPIVLTRTAADTFTAALDDHVNDVIRCEFTSFGPRFAGDDFETLVYPLEDGTIQTTLAYWQRVLTVRQLTFTATQPEVATRWAD